MPTTEPSCSPSTNWKSSGRPVRKATSVEPGFANRVVRFRRRKRSNVWSRTVRAKRHRVYHGGRDMIAVVSDPADLGVVDASAALAARELSSRELTEACLARIRERDGNHSHDGDPESINAWVRVYEEDALAAAGRADARLAAGDAPALCGIPIGLKDLFAVAGKPLTASSSVFHEVPDRDCDMWAALSAEGMVLLGHLHVHEFACGGTTDQVGSPWAIERSAGGSSGGSSAALASFQVTAATGTDTAGSLRIPSSESGTSTIKPTHGL